MRKDLIWYIILAPILFIILVIMSLISLGRVQFEQFNEQGDVENSETIR